MTSSVNPSSPPTAAASLCAGRFQTRGERGQSPFGTRYDATDVASGTRLTILAVDSTLWSHVDVGATTAAIANLRVLTNPNVSSPKELARDQADAFLVFEEVSGQSARELLAQRQQTNTGFNPKSTQNIANQVCLALEAIHKHGYSHGAVCLDTVFVNEKGQVTLADLGMGALSGTLARHQRAPWSAPELAMATNPSVASDVFALGALVYELLVGTAPTAGCIPPSQAVPGLNPLVDALVAGCMQPDPARRPQGMHLVRGAVKKALTPKSSGHVSQQVAVQQPSLAQAITMPPTGQATAPGGESALAVALADNYERWLISKGKLDYGPFPLAQVVLQIRNHQILPGHVIVDNETGIRTSVEEHPLLTDLVEEVRQKRDDERRAQAEVATVHQSKRRGTTLYVFVALLVLGLGGGTYAIVSGLSSDDDNRTAGITGIDEGSLETKISFPKKKRGRKGRRKNRRSAQDPAGTQGGWNDSLDLDMGSESSGSERLDDSQINPVIQRSSRKLGRCLRSTQSPSASIDFIVKGSGNVTQVRVNGKTDSGLANCVRKAMMSMKFPSFDGNRTKASFDMSL